MKKMQQHEKNAVIIGVVIVAAALIFFVQPSWLGFESALLPSSRTFSMEQQPSGLQVTDTVVGEGALAVTGSRVTVDYTGKLSDGTIFDASRLHDGTFTFTLGTGNVIAGWDQGVVGMKVGGKRTLIIPPELAYGPTGYGPIPPNATLTFDIELLKVE
jgi:FKBP-type peptidyl-prolyl cis-trans isomerase